MNPIEYYKKIFAGDIQSIQNVTPHEFKRYNDRISIFSLVPGANHSLPGMFAKHAKAFQGLTHKRLFLFCFFFSVLIDQAIHSSLRIEHYFFDKLAKYPKIVGILSGFNSNIHPALLLLLATLYINSAEEVDATSDFKQLTDFFIQDYCDFFSLQYPALTGRLNTRQEQIFALGRVFSDIVNAFDPSLLPDYLHIYPLPDESLNQSLYKSWTEYFYNIVKKKLNEY